MTEYITSVSNPLVKRIRALADKRTRRREGVFVVEGAQPVWRAVESGWTIDTLVIAPDLITNAAAFEMIQRVEEEGIRVARLSADLFTKLSERDGPAGMMAILEQQTVPLRQTTVGSNDLWLVLHRIHNPGNLGTIVRTADAVGCSGIILSGDCVDPFDPTAVKASMGSIFSLPMVVERSFNGVRSWATEHGVRLVATSGYADDAHWSADWSGRIGLVLGNEGDGLPEDVLNQADATVRIPMTGTAESLNLGVAAAVLLYEARRHQI